MKISSVITRIVACALAFIMVFALAATISFADTGVVVKYLEKDAGNKYHLNSSRGTGELFAIVIYNPSESDGTGTIYSTDERLDLNVNLILSNVTLMAKDTTNVKSLTTLDGAKLCVLNNQVFETNSSVVYFGNSSKKGNIKLLSNGFANIMSKSDSKLHIDDDMEAEDIIAAINKDNNYIFQIKGNAETSSSSSFDVPEKSELNVYGTLTIQSTSTLNVYGRFGTSDNTTIINNGRLSILSDNGLTKGAKLINNSKLYIGSDNTSVNYTILGSLTNSEGATLAIKGNRSLNNAATNVKIAETTLINNGEIFVDTLANNIFDFNCDNAVLYAESSDKYSAIANGAKATVSGKSIFFTSTNCYSGERTSEIAGIEFYCKEGNKWGTCEHTYNTTRVIAEATYSTGAQMLETCTKCGHMAIVTGEPKDITAKFTDLSKNAWYLSHICKAVDAGLFTGTSDSTFSPEKTMTRAEFVTVLATISGDDLSKFKSQTTASFTDVKVGSWEFAYVEWAKFKGISAGYSNGKFGSADRITNEQACVMALAFFTATGTDVDETKAAPKEFKDASLISSWAKDAVASCQMAGIIEGSDDGTLSPQNGFLRAQGAVVLNHVLDIFNAQ